jgi:hypothetical protein
MSKYIRPSSWGMKAVDVIFVFILVALVIKLLFPGTGLAVGIHDFTHLLASFISWFSGWIVQFLNWI